jgi:CRP/FNR family transcriptional regulator, anaerobic regulatory protein
MNIIDEFQRILPIAEECQAAVKAVIELKNYKKNKVFALLGNLNETLYYIESGLVRAFQDTTDTDIYKDTDTREIIFQFSHEGQFLFSTDSFFRQKPAKDSFETLEDSQIWEIKRKDFKKLIEEFPILNHHFGIICERCLLDAEQRVSIYREHSPEKKYEIFQKLYPHLPARLQVKHIAEFLDVHASTLSKVRHKLRDRHL